MVQRLIHISRPVFRRTLHFSRVRSFRLTPNMVRKTEPDVNFYELLGVKENSTGLEIEDAFMEKLADPNLNVGHDLQSSENEEKLEKSLLIVEAYNTLSHPSKRIDYDVRLRMIRRGDNPDKKREIRTKAGAFITVEKEELIKKSPEEIAKELMNQTTPTEADIKQAVKSSEQRARKLASQIKGSDSEEGKSITGSFGIGIGYRVENNNMVNFT